MKNFNTKINTTLDTLATKWNSIKKLNEDVKSTKTWLFIDLEKMVNDEALEIQETLECFVGLNKIALDLIEKIALNMDAKKDVKKLDILNTLGYKFKMNIKFYLGARELSSGANKGQKVTTHIGLGTMQKLAKLDFLTKASIKKINNLYIIDDSKNTEYLTALKTAIVNEEKRLLDLDREIAKIANLNKCSIDEKNIDAIIRVLQAKKKTYKA